MCKAVLLPAELDWFQEALCLFPKNIQAEEHNQEVLFKSKWPILGILANFKYKGRWKRNEPEYGMWKLVIE